MSAKGSAVSKTYECLMCDRTTHAPGEHGWCVMCEFEFVRVMARVTCARSDHECESPIACMGERRCVQIRAAVTVHSK